MAISFDDIENAFFFVSMDQKYMHNAYLCKKTGQIFYTSEMGDSDELPEDIDDPDKYMRGRGVYPKTCSLIFQVDLPFLNESS